MSRLVTYTSENACFVNDRDHCNNKLLKHEFPAGSFSRSAVNFMAGCQTAVSNMVMSMIVMLTLLVITPLFKYTPNAILSAIIISAVISLIDFEAATLIWKVDKLDFIACMGAFLGVVFISVEIGLLIAVSSSLQSPKALVFANINCI